MKKLYKILLFLVSNIALTLLLPFLTVKLAPADAGMAICMLLFFIGYPIYSIALGVIAFRDLKFSWWMPLVSSIVLPLFFSLAMKGMVWELYTYSGIYLFLGYGTLAFLAIVKKIRFERQK